MRLGTEAVYRVGEVSGEIVRVQVMIAPGLRPGQWLRLTADAVRSMSVVADWDPGRAPGTP